MSLQGFLQILYIERCFSPSSIVCCGTYPENMQLSIRIRDINLKTSFMPKAGNWSIAVQWHFISKQSTISMTKGERIRLQKIANQDIIINEEKSTQFVNSEEIISLLCGLPIRESQQYYLYKFLFCYMRIQFVQF